MTLSQIEKLHLRQQDQSDCGVACLLMALKYHGGSASMERLREVSGTTKTGTTLLGLIQGGAQVGLHGEGFSAEIIHLQECTDLCVLHVIKDDVIQHFILCYGWDAVRQKFLISDPASGHPEYMDAASLEKIWKTRSLVLFKPTEKIVKTKESSYQKWQWFQQVIRPDTNILLTAMAIGIVVAVTGLSTAIFSQRLLDDIIPSGDHLRLYSGLGLLLVLLLIRSFLSYIRSLFLIRQSKDFNTRITDVFYSSILHLPKSFFDHRKTGDLIARMTDTQRIQRTVSALFSSSIIDILMIVVSSVAIIIYHWQIGLISLAWLPVFTYIVYRFHRPILSGQEKVMQAYARSESHYIDTIQGVDVIKLRNKENLFAQINQSVYGWFQSMIYDLSLTGLRFSVSTEVAAIFFTVGIISWGAILVLDDALTSGAFIAILQMIGMLMSSAGRLAMVHIQIQEAKVAFDRMHEFTTIPSEENSDHEPSLSGIDEIMDIRVIGMNFRFPGRPKLLENVSFSIQKGEWITIMGESGSGKSTILQNLQKFYHPESGFIKINGIDLYMINTNTWRSKIGVVPQNIKLFSGNVIDNILIGDPVEDVVGLDQFFKQYGFDTYFSNFPQGYATLIGEGGINISGGQQQLLALARALYKNPEVILLDEPTSALDRETEHFVLDLLSDLKKEKIIICLTHNILTAKRSDRIYTLQNGTITQSGNHADLIKTKDNIYSKSWSDYTP